MEQQSTSTQQPLLLRIARVLLLLIILIAVNWLYIPATTWRGILTGEAGEVLYAAGFDGFTDEWQQYEGRESAQITDGALVLSLEQSPSVIYSAAQPYVADFDVSVDTTWQAGNFDNAYGVVYRLQEPRNDCRLPLQILCDLAETNTLVESWANFLLGSDTQATGYEMFLISSDGYYSVWRGTANGDTKRISTWIPSDAINQEQNATNRLRVIANGNQYRFYINDTQVDLCLPDDADAVSTYFGGECFEGTMTESLLSETFDTGQIALVVDGFNSSDTFTIAFDNLILTMPDSLPAGAQS